ncbi:MAG TPA: hypothetical protein VN877_02895 [Opitutaceae bacterium]|nr:hypothetical protein [Opitutaceae bacterium]
MPHDPYREILSELAAANVEFIVGGGVACVLQGVERVTMDVDLAVLMAPPNLRAFLAVMDRLGLRPRVPIPPESLLDPGTLRRITEEKHALVFTFLDPDLPVRQVDIFLREDLSFGALLPHSERIDLGGFSVRVLTRPKLLSIKLGIVPLRAKDAVDIEFLRSHVP